MLKSLIISFTLIGLTTGYSQSYFHSPNDTLIENTIIDGQVTMNITQVHPTNDTLHFIWTKLETFLPIGWEANICDNSNCYTGLENFGTTLPVLPGDDGLMLIHCTPHLNEGTAIIRYSIFEENSPGQIDTLVWIVNATVAGIEINSLDEPIMWYADHKLYFKGSFDKYTSIRILDLTGKVIVERKYETEDYMDFSFLRNSVYIVELNNEFNYYKQKIIINE